jgi:hypothetical protein
MRKMLKILVNFWRSQKIFATDLCPYRLVSYRNGTQAWQAAYQSYLALLVSNLLENPQPVPAIAIARDEKFALIGNVISLPSDIIRRNEQASAPTIPFYLFAMMAVGVGIYSLSPIPTSL